MTARSKSERIRETVRARYAGIATGTQSGCGCSTPSCCSTKAPSAKAQSAKLGYSKKELDAVPEESNMGLGCGNPQAIALLKKGKEESKAFIKDWFPGSGVERYVRSAAVEGTKPRKAGAR